MWTRNCGSNGGFVKNFKAVEFFASTKDCKVILRRKKIIIKHDENHLK